MPAVTEIARDIGGDRFNAGDPRGLRRGHAGGATRPYTKALAKQLIERGIRANVVAPGPVWTVLQPSGGQPDEKVKNFGKDSDFGRPGQPVELAPVFVVLASQEASFINGVVYGVTGGKGVVA